MLRFLASSSRAKKALSLILNDLVTVFSGTFDQTLQHISWFSYFYSSLWYEKSILDDFYYYCICLQKRSLNDQIPFLCLVIWATKKDPSERNFNCYIKFRIILFHSTFANIWTWISLRYRQLYYYLLLLYLLQVFLCYLQKSSMLHRLADSCTSWYQSPELEADKEYCLHIQTRPAERYFCLILYLNRVLSPVLFSLWWRSALDMTFYAAYIRYGFPR